MKKDVLAFAFLALLVAVLISGTKIQSVDEYYLTHLDDITPHSQTVTVSIRCDTVLQNWKQLDPALQSKKYVPANGVILPATKVVLRPKDTAFDILDRTVRAKKIQMEYQGADQNQFGSVYVKGIHYLYEFSCGPLSGWMYQVNGIYPNYGSSKYTLHPNDIMEWVYTCDLGRDVGNEWKEVG